ncbi:hypothetical protein KR200_008151 [Drosophila serrata]|nr:hypothetical protein KR200_008151 [Drosophila serrata]
MAMLAEPRRRKRYNLCPRGKALYEDDNRFGTKMLEKMGWSKGNGLGARQDGEKDFVRIRFKNDAEGLGYEAKDDQWTTHEEGFNGLLKSLNGGEDDKEADGKASESEEETRPMGFGFKADDPEEPPSKKKLKENISGMSLEQRSKQSKARVHYQKFTRGKDLSQYSEKDLANIFGKKATEDIAVPVVIEEPKEEQTVSPNFGGVQTVSTGLSVNDYFKQKMEAIKNKLKIGSTPENRVGEAQVNGSEVDVEEPKAENVSEEAPLKKKKKRNAESTVEPQITEPKKKKKSERSQEETEGDPNPVEGEETIVKKKKKKSKRSSPDEAEELEATFVEPKPAEDEETIVKKKKKNKKDKADKREETTDTVIETIEIVDEPAPKKKKSKKSEVTESEIILIDDNSNSRDDHGTNESEVMDELVRIKKKKSKKCEEFQNQDTNVVSEEKESPPKKKKKSKQDKTNIKPEETIQTDSPDADSAEKSSKKKKKSKAHVDEPVPEDATPELEPAFDTIDTDVSPASRSFGDKSDQSADEELPKDLLSLEEINERLKSFNTFIISQFCAEKFQLFDMSAFCNSTLSKIEGYATNENVELKVVQSQDDEKRIIDLWHNRAATKYRKTNNLRYPKAVQRTTIRAVKKRVAFQAI